MERPDEVDITSDGQWVDCSVVTPNPLHPRVGWDEVDESLEALAESMRLFDQRVACVVTPLNPVKEADLVAQGLQFRLIDGHRRWAVRRRTTKPLYVSIHKAALGQSISPVGSLVDWLERDAGKKPPTVHEIVI